MIPDSQFNEALSYEAISDEGLSPHEEIFQEILSTPIPAPAKPARIPNWLLSIVSAILFYASFYWWFGGLVATLAFVVVVIHELGHALAMKYYGFKNLRMVFVPFLGAAVIGNPPRFLSARKDAVVNLMGPVPGLLIALFIYVVIQPDLFSDLSIFFVLLVIINAINLLPFNPLDGGRLVARLFDGRGPETSVFFYLFSFAGILAVSLYLKSYLFAILLFWIVWEFLAPLYSYGALKDLRKRKLSWPNELKDLCSDKRKLLYEKALGICLIGNSLLPPEKQEEEKAKITTKAVIPWIYILHTRLSQPMVKRNEAILCVSAYGLSFSLAVYLSYVAFIGLFQ